MGIFTQRGIKVRHSKHTSSLKAVRIDHCDWVTLPMKQHIGAPCVPCVKQGDHVLAGQLVGRAEAPVSAPIHASISGTVQKPETIRLSGGEDVQAVVIKSDGEMKHIETNPPQVHSLEDFLLAVRDSGLVGLGGAGFPAHVKLRGAAGKADILLVNAAECEPYITADHREALDNGADIIDVLLEKNNLAYLQTIVFILIIAALVQFVETVLKRYVKPLYQALGIYLPLITTNCAVLGVVLLNVTENYGFVSSMVNSVGAGVGFLLAMVIFAGVRGRMEHSDIPKAFQGLPSTLVASSIVSLSFLGFGGIVERIFG